MFALDSSNFSPNNLSNYTVRNFISNRAKILHDSIAIAAPGRLPLTYSRLNNQIETIVKTLNKMGVGRHDRVAIVLPNGPEMAVAFLAVASGATCAPLNPNYKAKEFDFYLSDLKTKALVIQSGMNSPAISVAKKKGIRIIQLSPILEAGIFTLLSEEPGNSCIAELAQPKDVALVLHTSGTTSRPKIVPLTHYNICTSAYNVRKTLKLKSSDCCLNIMPLFHIHGLIGALLSTMLAGASIVCIVDFHAQQFFEWMKNFQPTWYTAVPTMHQAILERAEENKKIIKHSKLCFIRSSSSSLPPQVMVDLEKKFNVPVIESYGMTEAAHQMASNPLPPGKRKAGSVGMASGPEIEIIDDKGNFLPRGKIGEIVIRGPNVTKDYENNPEANKRAFTNGWFRTGDQGYFDEDNYLIITDRIKEIINRGGEKISPREIDEELLSHPSILQAVTFPFPHPKLGEDVAAAVVLRDNATVTEWEIQKFLSTRLAYFKTPGRILILDEIPKGSTGKLQRMGLAEKLGMLAAHEEFDFITEYKAPSTPLEKKLAKIWSIVLEIGRIGINDDYFQLGGNSIQAARIISLICESLQLEQIPLVIFLHAPTIEKMARLIGQDDFSVLRTSLIAIQKTGFKPKIYGVHACRGNAFFFMGLARYLGSEQPFYALRAQGLDGKTTPYTRIEDMATHYIKEIQAIQPEGPYLLCGAGDGGIIALEMSQQLIKRGKIVSILILIDIVLFRPSQSRMNISSLVQNFKFYLHFIQRLFMQRELFERVKFFLMDFVFPRLGRKIRIAEMGITRYKVYKGILKAVTEYRYMPNNYPNRIVLFTSEEILEFPRNPRAFRAPIVRNNPWLKFFTGSFDDYIIPGKHSDIFKEPNIQILAQRLRKYLDKVSMEDVH